MFHNGKQLKTETPRKHLCVKAVRFLLPHPDLTCRCMIGLLSLKGCQVIADDLFDHNPTNTSFLS